MTSQPVKAYVGLGSNLGDRAGNLLLGIRVIAEAGLPIVRLSSIYETEPVGVSDQPSFLNMVCEVMPSQFTPEQVMTRLLRAEYAMGRRREIPNAARNIDLDLLLYGNERRNSELLRLPHPRLHLRRFVLVPLAELAPNLLHPVLRRSISDVLAAVSDTSAVTRWRG